MMQKALKILIAPDQQNRYDQRMVAGLAEGFKLLRHDAVALATPQTPRQLAKACDAMHANVVIQINRVRDPDAPLPPNVRHIAWFQDVFPSTMERLMEGLHSSDIVYVLGDRHVLGINVQLPCFSGALFTGVDHATLEFATTAKPSESLIDFSLCGFMPAPLDSARTKLLLAINKLHLLPLARILKPSIPESIALYPLHLTFRDIVEHTYRPLRGELDIHDLAEAMRQALTVPIKDEKLISQVEEIINYFSRDYPRFLDREMLIDEALKVSRSLELYGPGWQHSKFRPYAKGMIEDQEGLLRVYKRSRINLANNTHGLGLHSRTLECMAVGGFLLMHSSPHDAKPGGMLTEFEPGLHYGMYTPETLQEEAHRWLKDEKIRAEIGKNASILIRERHQWRHRAEQILKDLKR